MSRPLLRGLGALALLVAIAAAFAYRDQLDMRQVEAWLAAAGLAAPLLFMALYALATVLFLPGTLMTLAGGALFGPVLGTFYNLTGATVGAALAFLVGRSIGGDWVQRRAAGFSRRLLEGVDAEGWRFVAFTRLMPLFPYNLLNYALGLTRIPFLHYLVASYVCMLPATLAYTYLGYAGREALAGGEGLVQKGLVALALLAALAFLPRLITRLRRAPRLQVSELKQRLDAGSDVLVLDVRSRGDFNGEQGHIDGAVNLPLEELPQRLDELQAYLERPIALICRTDRRSARASALLARNGFADVHVVRRGMTAWRENGWPVVRDSG